MSDEERRTVTTATAILLLASLLRFAWETRPVPPILPPAAVPAELLEETRLALEREERMNTPLANGERIDPNRDPDVELARLPGIGPALAARIVGSREGEGEFRRASDLLRVPGIGPATLERIQPHLDLPDPSRDPALGVVGEARRVGPSGRQPDLNSASAADLESLPGLGPALSARIVEYRSREGPFSSIEDLAEVPGIGSATIERLRNLLRVGP